MSASRRVVRLLLGVGLVIAGLLAGILFMLTVDDEPAPRPTTRIVKQVEKADAHNQRPAADSALEMQSGAPSSLSERFRDVAERVRDAVVSIRVRSEGEQDPGQGFFNRPPQRQNLGSGVLISPDGYVVTNDHVVQGASAIQVRMVDKRRFDARVVGRDEATDLAVLKIDGASSFTALSIGDSDRLQVGDWVVAVGNPFRLTSTVTAGIVSALGRQLQIIEDQFRIESFIQTDAAINPGNSGGALVNLDGELIGINTAIASRTGGYQGYGFAIPSTLMERVVTDLIEYGEMKRGYLGVSIQPVDAEVADEVGLKNIHGVYVAGVRQGSAADRAGLRRGDIVEAVAGTPVNAPNQLQSAVAMQRPGDVVAVRIWRAGRVQTIEVELMGEDTPVYQEWISDRQSSSQPEPSPQGPPPSEGPPGTITELQKWGMGLRPIDDQERAKFGVEAGVYVAYVEKGGSAADAGLPRDVVITALEDTPVERPGDVQSLLSKTEKPVLVQVQRSDSTQAFYEIE